MSDSAIVDEVVPFCCGSDRLWGILSRPAGGSTPSSTAVVIVVGGPQYRVGSHRQFVLLARALARGGVPALRFDYRGMGDSEGERRDFESVAPDLRAAVDALCVACPATRRVVAWGLCDGASAVLMFAAGDARSQGIAAAHPWAAREFTQLVDAAPPWAGLPAAAKVDRLDLAEADHTFSRQDWQQAVERATLDWVRRLDDAGEPPPGTVDAPVVVAAAAEHR